MGSPVSTAANLEHHYRYPFASHLDPAWGLRLATSGTAQSADDNPYFFEGRLEKPEEFSRMLLLLSNVVRSRFYLPGAMRQHDPVVTCSESVVRFEGFSSCAGVYVRVDASGAGFEDGVKGRGTTNVDFNSHMRAALGRVRQRDDVNLSVGADELKLTRDQHSAVEKKVKLPLRWIKGFTEVQAYQARLNHRLEVDGANVRRFLRALPKGGGTKQQAYVVPSGKGLRLTQRESKGAIPIQGTDRLRLLEQLVEPGHTIHIWSDEQSGVSGWEIAGSVTRCLLLLSPDVYRGFSGEGQGLLDLASDAWLDTLALVRAQLKWQTQLDLGALALQIGKDEADVRAALSVLASRGLVGFDARSGAYFHRELPFDLAKVEQLQPRLRSARKLVADGRVRLADKLDGQQHVLVGGTDVEHVVKLQDLQDSGDRCTCRWFSKYQGQRGPCKHILAARIVAEGDDE